MDYTMVGPEHQMLRTKLETFDFADPPVDPTELAMDLVRIMAEQNGLGLSANQLGLPYRVFCMRGAPPFVCFNPRIVDRTEAETTLDEGCLSFPNLVYRAPRADAIKVRFATPNGVVTTMKFNGMTARVFQHEMMHMDGMLPFEGIGRMKLDRALTEAARRGSNYRPLGLMKHA